MVCALRIKGFYVYFIVGFAVLLCLPASFNFTSAVVFAFPAELAPILGGFYEGLNCSGASLLNGGRRVPLVLPDGGSSACQFEANCASSSFNLSVANSSLTVVQFVGSDNCSVAGAAGGGGVPPPLAPEPARLPASKGCVAFPASNRSAWVNPAYPVGIGAAAALGDAPADWSTMGGAVFAAIPTSFYFAAILLWLLNTTPALVDHFPIALAPWQRAAAKRGAFAFALGWALSLLAVFLIGLAVTAVVPLRGGQGAFCTLEWPPVQLDGEWSRVIFATELASVLMGLAAAQLFYLSEFGYCHGGSTTAVPVIAIVALCRGPRNTPARCLTCRRPPGTYSPPHKMARLPGTISLPATALLFAVIGGLRVVQELLMFFANGASGAAAAPARFPTTTRGLLFAGCALALAAGVALGAGFYDVRGVPAVGIRAGAWLIPEPEEYLQPPPPFLAVALPPRPLLLKHLAPVDTAARLESCLECWLASPRRKCPRGGGAVEADAAGGAAASGATFAELAPGSSSSGGGGGAARSTHAEPLQCAMCYEVYEPAVAAAWMALVCGHVFHSVCIMKWAALQAANGHHVHCPLDRVMVSVAAPRGRGAHAGRDDGGVESWTRVGLGGGGWRSSRGRVVAQPPPGAVVLTPVAAPPPESEGGV